MAPRRYSSTHLTPTNNHHQTMDYEMEDATGAGPSSSSSGMTQEVDMGYGDATPDSHNHGNNPYGYGDMGYGEAHPDLGYGYAHPDVRGRSSSSGSAASSSSAAADMMGYGDARPDSARRLSAAQQLRRASAAAATTTLSTSAAVTPTRPLRRASMSKTEETQRRASIKAIMADNTKSPMTKRRSIQHLMDGRRNSINTASTHSQVSSQGGGTAGSVGTPPLTSSPDNDDSMGYGDSAPDADSSNPYGYGGEDEEDYPQQQEQQQQQQQPRCYQIQPRCDERTRHDEQNRPECTHYERNCTMIAPCCGAAFGCRICHDECPVLPPKIEPAQQAAGQPRRRQHRSASLPSSFTSMDNSNAVPEDTQHTIDRFAVKEVICRQCYTRQSSKTNNCVSCGIQFGEYHCNICNLWMSAQENPYHCADCGFCRVGGAENFQHCNDCNMCIDRNLYETHNCKAGKYQSNCPVCQEFLFSSRSASHEMPCGHAIHWDCFRQLAAHDSRCPVCKKTAETRDRMLPTWTAMAQSVALQPVPPDLARVVNITCNDCEMTADAQAWHFLGVQCMHCQSFNTVVSQIVLQGEEAHEFLEMNAFRQAIQDARAANNGGEDETTSSSRRRTRRVNRRRSAI